MASLYRKWRPTTFAEVSGQDHITKTLIRAIGSGRTTHAYLFAGPRGTGKTTMARLLAKAFNCETRLGKKQLGFDDKTKKQKKWSGEPCNECETCGEINEGTSLDVIEIDAASNRGIEEIRELREKVKFAPVKSHFKVFIIDEVHMLTKEAFNALLKTLEEPPKHAVFILATTEAHKVPTTIISRCQRYDFRRANIKDLQDRMVEVVEGEGLVVGPEVIGLLSRLADGSYRDGLSLLDQIASIGGGGEIGIEEARAILGIVRAEAVVDFFDKINNEREALAYLNEIAQEGVDIVYYVNSLVEGARRLILIKSGAPGWIAQDASTEEEIDRWSSLAQSFSIEELLDLMNRLLKAGRETKGAPLAQLPLELAVMGWWQEWRRGNEVEKKEMKVKVVEAKPEEEVVKQVKVQDLTKNESPSEGDALQVDAVSSGDEKSKEIKAELDQECWAKILEKMKPYNHSLHALLRDAMPQAMQQDKVVIKVRFRFHAKKLYETKNRVLVEQVCEEVVGRPVRLECLIDDSLPKPDPIVEEELIDAAVETFGIDN